MYKSIVVLPSMIKKTKDARIKINVFFLFISHHSYTYQYFLKGHILEYTNDFAHWAGESLEERALAEHLSNIDPYEFKNINDLRNKLLNVIDDYLKKFPEPREAMSGDEFYFNETVTLIFPAGIMAKNLAEFLMAVKYVSMLICYHFHIAKMVYL